MKKFFQGGTEASPSPRASIASNGYTNAGFLAAPSVAASSPRTPQTNTSSQQQYFDLQRSGTISPSPSSTMLLGSGVLASVQNIPPSPGGMSQAPDSNTTQGHTIERNEMHKGLKSLETLLVTFDEYRDLKNKLAKSEKRLAKNLADLSKCKMLEDIPSQTLQASSSLFDSITDTSSKHAKLIQKEYESLNEHCGKYFKRIAKEERAHEELLDTLDSKVKRAHAYHEKNTRKSGRIAIESHDKYIQTIQLLTQEISKAKSSHNSSIGNKSFVTSLFVASTLGGIADCEFKALCESVRKSGPHIGKLNEWLNFASMEGLANVQPIDLNDDAMGWAQVLSVKEAEIREEMAKQEQAKYAHLEHTQALLKAQQMGWMPPRLPTLQTRTSQQSVSSANGEVRPNYAVLDLPKLDSRGQVIERPPVSRTVSKAESQKSSSAPLKAGTLQQEPISVELTLAEENNKSHSQRSSLADGTIIDRGEAITIDADIKVLSSPMKTSASRDSSDAVPSLSTSLSKDSDDSANLSSSRSTGPSTPNEEMPPMDILIIKGVPERVEGILKKPDIVEEAKMKVERPTDRYVDLHIKPSNTTRESPPALPKNSLDEERIRRLSTRDHEKERERQIERESELQRRLMEAEERLRTVDRDGKVKGQVYRREELRPRQSEPIRGYQSSRHDEEIPAKRYEPERYAPAAGASQVSSGGVNRTLSTDSERSFVARMKARYQEDKLNAPTPIRPAPTFIKSGGNGGNKVYIADSLPSSASRSRIAEDQRILHAADCGCWSCFSSHHSAPIEKHAKQSYQQQQSSNSRRQTMPPLREDRLSPPHLPRDIYPRRSFEVEADRRTVMFANDYQTIR